MNIFSSRSTQDRDVGVQRRSPAMMRLWMLVAGVLLAALSALPVSAATTNYAYTTATNASLVDMSTGTTQLVAASADDTASPVTNIGFEFYMLGTRYTQFSASSNGFVRLGGTAVTTGQYALGSAGIPLIASLGSDLQLSATGKVHYKVIGTAPNRVLVIEFLNAGIIYDAAGTTPDGTSQVLLHETTGAIDLVYGAMNRNASTGFNNSNDAQHIGFSINSTAGNIASIDTNNVLSTAAVTANQFTLAQPMASLTSAADGARRIYTFTPAAPTAPTNLTFTAVTATSMTLNWVDSPDELSYLVSFSSDGINYSAPISLAANATSHVAPGLNPATNYFWRVVAVSDGSVAAPLSGSQSTAAAGNVVSTAVGGLWSQTSTWAGGAIPTDGDNVTIADGAEVTIDTAAVALSLAVGTGGSPASLLFEATNARQLTVGQSVNIASNGAFQSAATGTVTSHVLVVGANLDNAGTLDFSTNANTAGASITFAGAASNSFTGAGAITDIRAITVNKGTSRLNVLEVMPTNFTVRGVNTDSAGFLTLTNGTFKLSGSFTGTNRVFAATSYQIPVNAGFWMNNAAYVVAPQNASPGVSGLFRMTQGTFNIGTASGNSMGFAAGSSAIVEGGAINAAGRFAVSTATAAIGYTQSAGTVTVCTVGNASTTLACFDLGTNVNSAIDINGGTIVVQVPTVVVSATAPREYRNQAGAGITAVTGGTLQLGNANSGAAKVYTIGGVIPNLVITNTSGNHSAVLNANLVNYNNISLNITVNTGNTLNFSNLVFLFYGTTLTNNGTLVHNGASSNFVWFNNLAPVLYTGAGTVTAPMNAFSVQTDMGLTLDPASPVIVANAVRLFSGNVINSNRLMVGNGGATTSIVQIGNTTTPTAAGTFDSQLGFNPGTGGISLSYLRTTTSRVTGGEIPASRTVTTLSRDDNDLTHTLTLAGGDITVADTLTLTNGRVVTNAHTLIAGDGIGTETVTRTNGYVDGNLRKVAIAAAARTFEVGTANGYSPVTFAVTAGTFPTDVSAKAIQTRAPAISPADKAITRHWSLTATGITADLTFNYLDPIDVPATVTESALRVYRFDGGSFTDLGGTIDTTANTGSVAGVPTYSLWTLAEAGAVATGELTITPASLNFGDQAVGIASAAGMVTLANIGIASLDVTTLTTASAPFIRSGGTCSNTLPITIAAGASCTLFYTFTPSAATPFAQSLSVVSNGAGNGTIDLSGNGVQGSLTIAPASIAFGSVVVGNSAGPTGVTLTNVGNAALDVTTLDVATAPFARAGGSCSATVPFTLAAGASCTLTYTFTPSAVASANQVLTVTANAPGSGTITLSGTGINAAVGNLTIAPATVVFGNQSLGTTSALGIVTLGNDGTASLDVTSLSTASAPFIRTADGSCGNTLPITIAQGASCTLTYRYAPTVLGAAFQTFTVGASAPGASAFSLSGNGVPFVEVVFENGFE